MQLDRPIPQAIKVIARLSFHVSADFGLTVAACFRAFRGSAKRFLAALFPKKGNFTLVAVGQLAEGPSGG